MAAPDMLSPEDDIYRVRCRVMQIIAGALLAGLLAFLAVAIFVVSMQPRLGPADPPLISLMACAMFAINLPLAYLVPKAIARNAVHQMVARKAKAYVGDLIGIWQSTFLVARSLLQGAGFLGCIAYLVDMHWIGMAVVIATAALMIFLFPTENRIRAWVQTQEAALEEMRLQQPA